MYSRNIGNLMMSPLRPLEFVAALMLMSLIRLAIGVHAGHRHGRRCSSASISGASAWRSAAFFANLILTSWSVGLVVCGLLLRNGLGAEALAWSIMFLLLPLACVYYPVAVLPGWLQPIAWLLPPTYVFEGLRALLTEQRFRGDLMARGLAINVVLFSAAVLAAFLALLRQRPPARERCCRWANDALKCGCLLPCTLPYVRRAAS